MCAARIALGLQFQTLGSVSDDLIGAFGFDYAEIGTLIGAFMLPGVLVALPAGFAGRWFSDAGLVAAGLLLMALGGLAAAFADGFGMFATARVICGVGFVLSNIYFTKIIADLFAGREIATAMGILVMSWPLGIAIGQVGHVWLAAAFGWRDAFVAAGAYCVLAAGAVWLWKLRRPGKPVPAASLGGPLIDRRGFQLTIVASLVWGMFNAAYVVYLAFAPLQLQAGGYAPLAAAATLSLASWVMIGSGALCGQVSDRTGRPDLVLYVCMAAAVASMLLLPATDYAVPTALLFGLIGMAPAGVIMALTGDAMRPEHRAFGMGLFFTGYFLVMAPAPAIAGWIYDLTGDPFDPLIFAASLFAAAALANAVFRMIQRQAA